MSSVNPTLVPSKTDDGLVYLLIADYPRDEIQGVEYEIDKSDGKLRVYCYRSGFNDEDPECEGVLIPVMITEENKAAIDQMQQIEIVDPKDPPRSLSVADREVLESNSDYS